MTSFNREHALHSGSCSNRHRMTSLNVWSIRDLLCIRRRGLVQILHAGWWTSLRSFNTVCWYPQRTSGCNKCKLEHSGQTSISRLHLSQSEERYTLSLKVKVSPIYDPYVEEVPIREDTCPGPSALWSRVASSFPRRLYLSSVSTGSPFAARGR